MLTDNPLSAGIKVLGDHLLEVRKAINAVRALAGLGDARTTDAIVLNATKIKAVHITELRPALDEARDILGFSTGGCIRTLRSTVCLLRRRTCRNCVTPPAEPISSGEQPFPRP